METTAATTEHVLRRQTPAAAEEVAPHREYHHGKSPAGWFGAAFALLGFVLGSLAMVLGPSWPLLIAGAACIVIGLIGGWGLSIAGYGQPPRP